ncbi:bromodomain-containing protein DDB_G0270170-like [Anneissia japonica]|uniref:bromodomain-containing protein DDB_G0270170-like n=1 Tax=Anneissia japonica TaxID=1529436 RepID=UPI001425AD0B|nr:bromodomain-containing protein DDB_G0270170-like [Anneissia japonica]
MEEKRKAAEAEQRRLAALPPWKRVIEERNVIIVSADNTTPDIDIKISEKTISEGKNKASNKLHTSIRNDEGLEKEKGVDGVSEEHCTSVEDNPFLKLDRNKSRPRPRSEIIIKNSNTRNGDVVFQSQPKTRPNSHFISGINNLESVPVEPNVNAKSTNKEKTLNHTKNSNSNECKVLDIPDKSKESIDESDIADKKQLSVSELLGRFKSSSQENLLDVPRESRSIHQRNKGPRSKSLDRNLANTELVNSTKTNSTASSVKSQNVKHAVKSNSYTTNHHASSSKMGIKVSDRMDHVDPDDPVPKVTIIPNRENIDLQKKKKNKPDLSASELIDLGKDVPLSPLSKLSPFNFEIIESAHIGRPVDNKMTTRMEYEQSQNVPSSYSAGNRDNMKENSGSIYSSVSSVPANRYKKHSDSNKAVGSSGNRKKFNDRSKTATDNVGSKSSKSSASNEKLKLPPSSMPPQQNNVEDSPIPPPRNKKKKKAPILDDVLKIKGQVEDIDTNKQSSSSAKTEIERNQNTPILISPERNKRQSPNKVKGTSGEKTEQDSKRKSKTSELPVTDLSKNKISDVVPLQKENGMVEEDQLPVSNIDDIELTPVEQKSDEIINKTVNEKPRDVSVVKNDSEKKKGVVKKLTSVEFIGENEYTGKPSILKSDDSPDIKKTKNSVMFNQQLSVTFEYASELSANQYFDELESADDSENLTLIQDSDTQELTESSTDINEDDDVEEDKSVDGGLKSNTSIGNKGLQGYVPSYLQKAYMSTIEEKRNQDVPTPSPAPKEVIEDEQIEAVPETNSDLFSGWSSGNTAMLF